jgi:putative phosphoribosyl transferase
LLRRRILKEESMFRDRFEAGAKLAEKVKKYKETNAVIIAIPRGGLEVGYAISKETGLPLDVILIKKIGHPLNKEFAIGSVSLSGRIINQDVSISQRYIEEETIKIREELKRRYERYFGEREPVSLKGKTVIFTDDGIATGSTMLAAIELAGHQHPEKIVIAVPVAPFETIKKLELIADEVICDLIPPYFHGVGEFYEHFLQVPDAEAISLLRKANHIEA